MEDAYSNSPFQVEVLSFTEHGYPLSSTLRSTSLCAVKPFPRHRAKQSLFQGLQRHTTLLGVCLLHPPGTLTLNRSFLLPLPVPRGRIHPYTWHEDPWMEDAYSHPPFQVEGSTTRPGTSSIVRAIFLTPGPSLRPTPQGAWGRSFKSRHNK